MSILCYHAVDPRWESPMAVTPREWAEQARWLARHRTVVPLAEATARLDRRGRLPRGMVALTFDDGFASLYDEMFPVLRRYGLPATVFLVAQTLSAQGRPVDWVDTAPEWPLATLTVDQVLEMQDAGVDFQSHSWAHQDLTTLDDAELRRDLADSRDVLESLLGRPVRQLCYPRGRHDSRVQDAARRTGHTHAYALPERPEPPGDFAIPRVGVHRGNSLRVVRVKDHRAYLPVRTSRAYDAARALRRRLPA